MMLTKTWKMEDEEVEPITESDKPQVVRVQLMMVIFTWSQMLAQPSMTAATTTMAKALIELTGVLSESLL